MTRNTMPDGRALHPQLLASPSLLELQGYIQEALEYRDIAGNNAQQELIMLVEEVGELAKAFRKLEGRKLGLDVGDLEVEQEIADVLWMLLSLCNKLGVDAEQALRQKDKINKKRIWA